MSSETTHPTPDSAAAPAQGPSAGELLKQGRLRQRLALSDCAKRTHIASRFLEALEEARWNDLPSESHRLGFMRSYARFLGVPAEDVVAAYRRHISTAPSPAEKPREPEAKPVSSSWFPGSLPRLIGSLILLFLLAWGLYHRLPKRRPEEAALPLSRERPEQTRLISPAQAPTQQRVRLIAEADSWLRVQSGKRLLYEGILPAGSQKEWSGIEEFQIRIGNALAVKLFWNDQPVDIQTGASSGLKDVRLPPPS